MKDRESAAAESLQCVEALFEGVFLAGFECSEHVNEAGRRLDVAASTRHLEFADADHERLRGMGITACREGVSWIHGEPAPGKFDFSRAERLLVSARTRGMQILWDLMHFGWPPDVDVFSHAFPWRLARFAEAFATWLRDNGELRPTITPVNEISFLSWAGGDARVMNPYATGRGVELKTQLVRATLASIDAVRSVLPEARFLSPEPAIRIVPTEDTLEHRRRVEAENGAQFQAWDMLGGRLWPGLGGAPEYLDVIGVNYYPHNQFTVDRETVWRGEPGYERLSTLLIENWRRYGRPMILSETGCEGDARCEWINYVAEECLLAMNAGCEIHGITLYPVLNHPGWADDRHCENGLWDYADDRGHRLIHEPLEEALRAWTPALTAARARMLRASRAFVTA
jgi:hypothetical protein